MIPSVAHSATLSLGSECVVRLVGEHGAGGGGGGGSEVQSERGTVCTISEALN